MTHRPYMVVFPCGNRNKLEVCYVRDYQEDEWALASRRRFDTEAEAMEYAEELSESHGIPIEGKQYYLD